LHACCETLPPIVEVKQINESKETPRPLGIGHILHGRDGVIPVKLAASRFPN
jgi:hypothetical protein